MLAAAITLNIRTPRTAFHVPHVDTRWIFVGLLMLLVIDLLPCGMRWCDMQQNGALSQTILSVASPNRSAPVPFPTSLPAEHAPCAVQHSHCQIVLLTMSLFIAVLPLLQLISMPVVSHYSYTPVAPPIPPP